MYSPSTLKLLCRQRRRHFIRRLRQSALFFILLVVSIWAYFNWRADNFTFAWNRTVKVLVLAIVDPNTDFQEEVRQGFLERFLHGPVPSRGNMAGVQRWIQKEYRHHTGRDDLPVEFVVRGPVRAPAPPPLVSLGETTFWSRWRTTRAFLNYFEEMGKTEGIVLRAYDVALFVYFYDESEEMEYAGQHSVASRRNRRGVVFSPLGAGQIDRCCTLIAHELCHTLGASDKYIGEQSIFPDGFADPDRNPPYPQDQAEIMALGIPIAPGREARVDELGDCVIGRKTAEEIGW